MIGRVIVFLLVGGVFGRSFDQNYYKKFEWGYGKDDGPQVWGKYYPECNGLSQSPIVLPTVFSDAPFLKRIQYHDWAEALKANLPAYIVNDGKFVTWKFNTTFSKVHPSISGSIFGQKERFLFEKNVVRVGTGENAERVGTSVAGSEHGMNGQFYPGEIQWYWYNSKFNSFEEASKSPGNIVITAGFFEVVNYENPLTNDYFDNLYKINGTRIPAVIPWEGEPYPPTFDKKNKCINCDYYFYEGSLSTPPCSEGALWHVYMSTFKVSERQINLLRSLLSSETHEPLVNNIRYVQATNFRDVLQHREKAPEDYDLPLPKTPPPYSSGYPPDHNIIMPPILQDEPLTYKQQPYKEGTKPPTYPKKTNQGKHYVQQPYQGVAYPPPSHEEGPYPPMPYPGIPYSSEAYQEFPYPPETYLEVPYPQQDYQEVTYPPQDYQEVPYPPQDYQEVPYPLQDYQEVTYPLQDYQEVPYPLQYYQEVPYSSQDYQEVPNPTQDYQKVPYPLQYYQEVPYPLQDYQEVPYPQQDYQEVPNPPQDYQEVQYPPEAYQEVPYPPQDYQEVPYPLQDYQEVTYPPQDYQEVPYPLQYYQEVPYSSQDYQEVPNPTQDYQEVPYPPQYYQEVPYPPQDYQEVPYPLQDYQEVPYPQQDYPELPNPPQDYQKVQYPPEAYQEVPYPPEAYKEGLLHPQKAYQEVPYTPEAYQKRSDPQMPFSGAPFPPEYLQQAYREETYPMVPYPLSPYPPGHNKQYPRDGKLFPFGNPFSMFTDLVEAVAGSSFNVAVSGSRGSDGSSDTSVEVGKNN